LRTGEWNEKAVRCTYPVHIFVLLASWFAIEPFIVTYLYIFPREFFVYFLLASQITISQKIQTVT
jgi:hypothetical protein